MGSTPAVVPRVYLHTLGCPKNEADSRAVARYLAAAGALMETDPANATHILINTCGFIAAAKEESIDAILDACREYADREVLVMGCLVERYQEELQQGIPEVAGWFGLMDAAAAVTPAERESGPNPASRAFTALATRLGLAEERARGSVPTVPAYSYLKISDGCDQPCTFCAIPAIKGGYHAAGTARILEEAGKCLQGGTRELVLVGQDTTVWEDGGLDLRGLIDLLVADVRVRRVRLMYLQPEHITDALLRYMAEQPKLCRYLDVPFQHVHPEVLRRMGRTGDAAAYLDLLERARRLMPDVSVRSTFIVGFPGETQAQFEALLEFVERAGFDHGGGFVYSPEEGTPAAALRPRVSTGVARSRLNRLNAMLEECAQERLRRLVGSRAMVLVDSVDFDGAEEGISAVGRTCGQAPEVDGVTYIDGDLPEETGPGDEVPVTVRAVIGYDLLGTADAS
jgi:ribosomal protein S12 methylthiotransferase